MKKKVLFVLPDYCHGGTNKSLENLLQFLDKDRFDISIYVLYVDGVQYYRNVFHPYIVKKSLLYYLAHDNVVTRKLMGALMKLSPKVNFNWLYRYEVNRLQRKHHFDSIVAYQEATATVFVARLQAQANTVAWVHCNYGAVHHFMPDENDRRNYARFNHIVCVSRRALESFLSIYPELSNRSTYIYNTIKTDDINRMADENRQTVPFESETFNIISVGRFAKGKGFEKIPEICNALRQRTGHGFCWYIIGNGDQALMDTTQKEIEREGLQSHVVLLGAKDNPYPFIRQANLLASTSDVESWSYVVAEAKALGTPVLANNYPVASEVVPPECGWVCPLDNMSQLIADLMVDKDGIYSRVKSSSKTGLEDNRSIAKKVMDLL